MCFRKTAEASMRKKGWRGEAGGRKGKRVADRGRRGVARSGRGSRL